MGNHATKQHQQAGRDKPKKFVHWKSAERPSPPGRPILIPLSDQQPDVITLKWERPRLDGGSPIVGYIVEHRRTGSPHWVRATPTLVPRTEASLSGLEPGWRYQFRVIAENVIGRSDPSELSDALTVTLQRNAITVPRFVTELSDTIAVENERIEMRVAIVGTPPPDINWFKDGFEIFSSRRTKIVNEPDFSVLIIHQVALTDEGEIKCTATNRAGHVVTRARLKVEAPPKIRLPRQYEDGLIVEAEETLRLKVGIAGQPSPAVIWSHEGDAIGNGGRFELVTTDKNTSLKIANVKRSDRGEYSVRAINRLSEDVASFLVTVTARPDPPGRVQLTMSFGKSASLAWTAPVDDGGCKIGNYIVEYFRIGWNVWLKAATTRQLNTTLHDLIEGSEYKFRVKAENPYGVSEPSGESDVLFVPDPKRGINKPEDRPEIEGEKPTPPSRKTLSPLRNFFERDKRSAEREPSPSKQRAANGKLASNTINPDMLDSETLTREMSYGTPNEILEPKDTRRSPSFRGAQETNLGDRKTEFNRSPSPMRRVLDFVTQAAQRSPKPPPKFPKSPKLDSKNSENAKPESGVTKSPVQKREEEVQTVTRPVLKREIKSPVVQPKKEPIRTEPQEPQKTLTPVLDATGNRITPPATNIRSSPSLQRSQEPVKLDENQNIAMRPVLPNPTIQISAPSSGLKNVPPPPVPQSRPGARNNYAQRNGDEVHTSSEFMLVLYSNKKSKESEKQESFDLELDEALQPPPLSLSTPDLSICPPLFEMFQMRRSASSTELLYERAMARFYEAVELEEAERAKKLHISQDQIPKEPIRKRLGSIGEAERLSFERRNNLRRKFSGEIAQNLISTMPPKWDSKEHLNFIKGETGPGNRAKEKRLSPSPKKTLKEEVSVNEMDQSVGEDELGEEEDDYDDDYTESTASSEDSMEKFKMELMARTRSASDDMGSYRPQLEPLNLSPYRSPTPDQASIVLNRPMPLASPEFVPKPILKRPSSEDVLEKSPEPENGKKKTSPKAKNSGKSKENEKSKENNKPKDTKESKNSEKPKENLGRGLMGFFKREKSPAAQNSTSKKISPPKSEVPKPQSSPKALKSRSLEDVLPAAKPLPAQPIERLDPIRKEPLAKVEPLKKLEPVPQLLERVGKEPAVKPGPVKREDLVKVSLPQRMEAVSEVEQMKAEPVKVETIESFRKRQQEEAQRRKLESKKSAEEEQKVVIDYYSNIVKDLGHTRKNSVPLYLRGNDLMRAAEEEEEEKKRQNDSKATDDEELLLMAQSKAKPRLSIVERIQVKHVQNKSKLAVEKPVIEDIEPEKLNDDEEAGSQEVLSGVRGRTLQTAKMGRRRTPSGARTRDGSAVRNENGMGPPKRNLSRSRTRNASKSPHALNRAPLDIGLPLYTKTLCEDNLKGSEEVDMSDEAQMNVRTSVAYVTDLGLFLVACWIYIFKDARLVLPILGLLVYRQLGEAVMEQIPSWMKRKKS